MIVDFLIQFSGIQEKLGILNGGRVSAVYDYEAQNADELTFRTGDELVVLRKGDDFEREWWWSRISDHEGYIPRNLLGVITITFFKTVHDLALIKYYFYAFLFSCILVSSERTWRIDSMASICLSSFQLFISHIGQNFRNSLTINELFIILISSLVGFFVQLYKKK